MNVVLNSEKEQPSGYELPWTSEVNSWNYLAHSEFKHDLQ